MMGYGGGAFMDGAYDLNGWGIYDLNGQDIYDLNGWGIYGSNGWDSYGKVSYFFGRYAQKTLVFRGVPFPVLA